MRRRIRPTPIAPATQHRQQGRIARVLALVMLVLGSGPAMASWQLAADDSRLSFASIKQGDTGEVHYFRGLSGGIDEAGHATLRIDLASVETAIDIRNERMREHLFNVAEHPEATVTMAVDPAALRALAPGKTITRQADAKLALAGTSATIETSLLITRVGDNRLLVEPERLLIIDASTYDLASGVRELREIAGLERISHAVPADFRLVFERAPATP